MSDTPTPGAAKGRVICVFCGASGGSSPVHLAAARSLAHALHENGISLVYGGGTTGLMGEIAKTLVSLSGPSSVHGIIPEALMEFERTAGADIGNAVSPPDEKVWGRTTVVADMHTRKQAMAREVIEGGPGSGFVALSGGYGTLEELMEMVTWNQLGIHKVGICLYNVEGYWDGLIQWVKAAVTNGFVSPGNGDILVEALDANKVIVSLRDYKISDSRFKLNWSQK